MYLVMFKDKTHKLVSREEKDSLSDVAGSIVKALKIDYLLEVTMELVPNTDEGAARKDNVAEFVERFGQNVLTLTGKEVKLKEWFDSSKAGEQCYVATEELTPVKRIRAISAKKLEVPTDSAALVPAPVEREPRRKPEIKKAEKPVAKAAPAPAEKKPATPPKVVTPPVSVPPIGTTRPAVGPQPKTRVRRTRAQLIADGYYDASGNKKD